MSGKRRSERAVRAQKLPGARRAGARLVQQAVKGRDDLRGRTWYRGRVEIPASIRHTLEPE